MLIKKDSMNGCRPHRRRRPFLLGGSGYVTCTAPYRAEKHEEDSVMPLYRVSFEEQGSYRVECQIRATIEANHIALAVQTIFPNFVLQQLRNSLAVRLMVPKGPRAGHLMWIAFGFADDDERRTSLRLKQANMMGPAGLISMEDGMIGTLIQQGIEGDKDKASVLELGGCGIEPIAGSRASEGSVRGFWTGYRELTRL